MADTYYFLNYFSDAKLKEMGYLSYEIAAIREYCKTQTNG